MCKLPIYYTLHQLHGILVYFLYDEKDHTTNTIIIIPYVVR